MPGDSMPGQVWSRPLAASGPNVYLVWGNNTQTGFIRAVKLRRSTDGGSTWLPAQELVANTSLAYLSRPKVTASGDNVYVVMDKILFGRFYSFVIRSSDGGATWDSVRQVSPNEVGSWDIKACGETVHIAFIRGVNPSGREIGEIFSSDRGQTWSSGQLLSTVDPYVGWEPQIAPNCTGNVYVIWQDEKFGSSSGFSGTVLTRRSTDNGDTWLDEQRISSLPSAGFSSVAATDSRVFVVWDDDRNGIQNSTIQFSMSENAGSSWCPEQTVGDTLDMNGDPTVDADLYGRVHITWGASRNVPRGLTAVFHTSGDAHSLYAVEASQPSIRATQNFPNPFNPSTQFDFELPVSSNVSLSIYDVLGRQIAELANGVHEAGYHSVTWNGMNQSSGVYFARFRVVDEAGKQVYSRVNKLVLMK